MLKVLWFLLAFALVVVGGTVIDPYAAQYGVKSAAKNACNEHIRRAKGFEQLPWEEEFRRRARGAGVDLKSPQQYAFRVEEDQAEGRWVCRYKVAWNSTTPWFLLSTVQPELRPLKITHRIDDTHSVSKTW